MKLPPESELIKTAIANIQPQSYFPRWMCVKSLFATNEETSRMICERYGYNPDQNWNAGSIEGHLHCLPRGLASTERDILELAATGEPSAEWLLELLEAGDETLLGMLNSREP